MTASLSWRVVKPADLWEFLIIDVIDEIRQDAERLEKAVTDDVNRAKKQLRNTPDSETVGDLVVELQYEED